MYKCHVCGKQFQGGDRRDPQTIFDEYLHGKQTYAQLAERYPKYDKLSGRTFLGPQEQTAKPQWNVTKTQDKDDTGVSQLVIRQ